MWMKKNEEEFLKKYVNKDSIILEWGSGESTLFFSNICKHIVSIEHDENWFNKIKQKYKNYNNLDLILKTPNIDYIDGIDDGSLEQFLDYIKAPCSFNFEYNLILIDGRARVECAKILKNLNISENCIIFVHDYFSRKEEYNYKEIEKYLELKDYEGDLALFIRRK